MQHALGPQRVTGGQTQLGRHEEERCLPCAKPYRAPWPCSKLELLGSEWKRQRKGATPPRLLHPVWMSSKTPLPPYYLIGRGRPLDCIKRSPLENPFLLSVPLVLEEPEEPSDTCEILGIWKDGGGCATAWLKVWRSPPGVPGYPPRETQLQHFTFPFPLFTPSLHQRDSLAKDNLGRKGDINESLLFP